MHQKTQDIDKNDDKNGAELVDFVTKFHFQETQIIDYKAFAIGKKAKHIHLYPPGEINT